jgi:ABC-type sugar transport system permease subunit
LGIDTSRFLWLNHPSTSKLVVVFFALWHGLGYTVLICLSGLKAISHDLYEAAAIDGAGPWRQWWHITLPNMRPIFIFLIMTGSIGALKRFQDVYTLGGAAGAPARSIQTVVGYVFEQAFGIFQFGAASAAAYLLFLVILGVTLVNYRLFLRKEAA